MLPELSLNEQKCLQTLKSYEILDTPAETAFDNLVKLAAQICATPIATVTLIDEERQWCKASLGLPRVATERSLGFCDYTVRSGKMMVRQVLTFARGVDGERIVVNVAHVIHDLENLIRDTTAELRQLRFMPAIEMRYRLC